MSGEYFVMLYTQRGEFVAMVGDDEQVMPFSTEEQARQAAKNNILGDAFGYEIFRIGEGDS